MVVRVSGHFPLNTHKSVLGGTGSDDSRNRTSCAVFATGAMVARSLALAALPVFITVAAVAAVAAVAPGPSGPEAKGAAAAKNRLVIGVRGDVTSSTSTPPPTPSRRT